MKDKPILINPALGFFAKAGIEVNPQERWDFHPLFNEPRENIRLNNPDRRFVRKKKRERGAR